MIFPIFFLENPLKHKKYPECLENLWKNPIVSLKETLMPLGTNPVETLGGDFLLPQDFSEKYRYKVEGQGSFPLDMAKCFPGKTLWVFPGYKLETPLGAKESIHKLLRPSLDDFITFYDKTENKWIPYDPKEHLYEEKNPHEDPNNGEILENQDEALKSLEFYRILSPPKTHIPVLRFPSWGYFVYRPLLFCVLEEAIFHEESCIPQWTLTLREL